MTENTVGDQEFIERGAHKIVEPLKDSCNGEESTAHAMV